MAYNENLKRSIWIKNIAIDAINSGDTFEISMAYELFLTDTLAKQISFIDFLVCIEDIIKRRKE